MENASIAPKRILIIEDDRFIGEMYGQALSAAGFAVEWAADGEAGLAAAKKHPFDLILLDIMLPGKMGSEILHELKSDPQTANSHVIVTTNFEQDKESRAVMESQVDAYLIKADITPRRLVEIVRSVI